MRSTNQLKSFGFGESLKVSDHYFNCSSKPLFGRITDLFLLAKANAYVYEILSFLMRYAIKIVALLDTP